MGKVIVVLCANAILIIFHPEVKFMACLGARDGTVRTIKALFQLSAIFPISGTQFILGISSKHNANISTRNP